MDSGIVIISEFLPNPKLIFYSVLGIVNVLILIKFIQWKKSRKHLYELAAKIPDVNLSYIPVSGHAHNFFGGVTQVNKCLSIIYKPKLPLKMWVFNRLMCFINRPEHAEIIMNNPNSLDKNELYDFFYDIIGTSIFVAPVSKWKNDRKHISPTFNKANLESYVEIFSEQAKVFCQVLEGKIGKGFFDMLEPIELCTLDGLCESTMGTKIFAQTSHNEFSKLLHRGMDLMMGRLMNVFYHNNFIYYNLLPVGKKLIESVDYAHNFANKIITDKRIEYRALNKDKVAEIDDAPFRKSLLEQLVEVSESSSDLSHKDVLDNITTFLIVGTDTSARTTALAFVMMGMHPEYQQKIYEEVIDVIGHDRPVYAEDLPKLNYIDKFLKETMRLFPIAPNIGRNVDEDIDLGEYVLPKGSQVLIGIFSMHRSAELYPDPLKFDPERFSPEETAKRHPYAYVPFSAGPRFCIGMKYAMMSMKTQIAMAARKFRFETSYKSVEDISLYQAIVLTAKGGQPVKVTLR